MDPFAQPHDIFRSHAQHAKLACFYCGESEGKDLKSCSRCKRVKYCSTACQTKSFKHSHKLYCQPWAAFVAEASPAEQLLDVAGWQRRMVQDLALFESKIKLQRKLPGVGSLGQHMLYLQPRCLTCLRPSDELQLCERCSSVGWCSDKCRAAGEPSHRAVAGEGLHEGQSECSAFVVKKADDQFAVQSNNQIEKPPGAWSPERLLKEPPIPFYQDWDAYFASLDEAEAFTEMPGIRRVLITRPLSLPLVILAGLARLVGLEQFNQGGKKTLDIHMVGAAYGCELGDEGGVFEELLHCLPAVQQLQYTLVGPQLAQFESASTVEGIDLECCPDCSNLGRKRMTKVFGKRHQDVDLPKPDLLVAFNCGAHENPESWSGALKKMLSHGAPVILTSLNQTEAVADAALLKSVGGESVKMAWEAERCPFRGEHLRYDYLAQPGDRFYATSGWWSAVQGA